MLTRGMLTCCGGFVPWSLLATLEHANFWSPANSALGNNLPVIQHAIQGAESGNFLLSCNHVLLVGKGILENQSTRRAVTTRTYIGQ